MTSEQRTAAAEAESENSNLKNADLNSANNADRISNEEEMQDISEKRDSAKPADSQSLMPWSFRIGYFPRLLVNMFSALAVSFVGTFTYRNGIDINIPYGLVLAFAILGISIWLSRARSGAVGLGLHLFVSSSFIWFLAARTASNGSILIPAGGAALSTFFSHYSGYIWLYGSIVLHILILIVPKRFAVVRPRMSYEEYDRIKSGGKQNCK